MRAVIICGGEPGNYARVRAAIRDDDTIICADYGYAHAKKMGLLPHVVLGDFDSYSHAKIECDNVKVYPPVKNYTDSEIAVNYACEHGADEILLLAATGGRLDHTLGNLYLLKSICEKGIKGSIFDGISTTYFVRGQIQLSGSRGDLLSIVPFEHADDFVTEGLEYVLNHDSLTNVSMGISNVFTEESVSVKIGSGGALVIHTPLEYA